MPEKKESTRRKPRASQRTAKQQSIEQPGKPSASKQKTRPEQRGNRSRRRPPASKGSIHKFTPIVLSGVVVGLFAVVVGLGWYYFNSNAATSSALVAGEPQNAGGFIPVSLPNPSPQDVAARKAQQAAAENRRKREQSLTDVIIPYLQKHCADCHGTDAPEGDISVAGLNSLDQFLNERKTWERVYRMINAGAMPPSDYEPRPSMDEQQKLADLLYGELYEFDCNIVYNAGRPTVQRLNKAEYNNTIRDLFGINITPADNFPADDVGEGFDNIGDVLSLPPLLMEKYLTAAEQVAAEVIDTTDYSKPLTLTLPVHRLRSSAKNRPTGDHLLLASHGTITGEFDVPATGEYEIRIRAMAHQMDKERARFSLSVNDSKLDEFDVQQHKVNEDFSLRAPLEVGKQKIVTTFLNDAYDGKRGKDRNFGVVQMQLYGPLGDYAPDYSDVHRRIVTMTPKDSGNVREAAYRVFQPLLDRAFRRPVTDAEVQRYAGLVNRAVEDMGETYEMGISLAIQAMLVSPEFLFRLEAEPPAGQVERSLNEFELANRLSYFLWSSMPDEELFNLARSGKLKSRETLRNQIQRMIKDEKSEALVRNFAAQWLNLRSLDEVTPDTDKFKFNDDLRRDMRRETELLFKAVMQEDRSIEDLLSADFTFLNQRLAEHYDISGVKGDQFERVSLTGSKRSGILTHASILTLTSEPGRTSPVKRGKWILENIFGEAPPPPPPGVPELEETAKGSPDASLREQLALHREDPGCASCHKVMDPLGLGFENFDAVGQWREKDGGKQIDASGTMPSGESFNGSLELIKVIQNRREKYFRTLTDKMLTYAVGRGTHYYDRCAVDKCLESMKHENNRFSALVEAIVLSDPFQKKTALNAKLTAR